MWAWLKSLFSGKKEAREVRFCKKHGTELIVHTDILSYNEYDGLPELTNVTRSCPNCDGKIY